MTNEVTAPATVTITAQGFSCGIELGKLPPASLEAMIVYGVRRRYQDAINSMAKELRDAGESVDGEALFTQFHQRVMDGTLGVRGAASATDPLDKYRKAIVRSILMGDKQSKAAQAYLAIDSSDQAARNAYLLELATKNAEKIDALAAQQLAADERAAKAALALSL